MNSTNLYVQIPSDLYAVEPLMFEKPEIDQTFDEAHRYVLQPVSLTLQRASPEQETSEESGAACETRQQDCAGDH